jgi:predicted O-methyltransferase YrrM
MKEARLWAPGLPIVAGAQTETGGLFVKLNHCRKIAAIAESGAYLGLCAFWGLKEAPDRGAGCGPGGRG